MTKVQFIPKLSMIFSSYFHLFSFFFFFRYYTLCLNHLYIHFIFFLGNVRYIWTSGRKCNFAGCERSDLQPPNVNGWFWSGSGAKIGPTTQRNTGDWSFTGGFGQAQPDNREAAQVRLMISIQ